MEKSKESLYTSRKIGKVKLKVKVKKILKSTKCKFEKIIDKSNKIKMFEGLIRPKEVDGINTYTLLQMAETSGTTFEIFKHMLGIIQIQVILDTTGIERFSINAYSEDIVHPEFLSLIQKSGLANRLVIELTEKEKCSLEAITILKGLQETHNLKIAMDDIHPTASVDNYSMKTLEQFKNYGVFFDIGKIDGRYFQNIVKKNNYKELKDLIFYNHNEYKITEFVIEFIETPEQYQFALQLEKDFPNFQFLYQGYLFDE